MNDNKLSKTYLRTIQYWFEDGIVELGIGGLFLLLGIYFYLQATLENKVLAEQLSAACALVFVVGWLLIDSFIRSAKERFTFPRTGYVAYKLDKNNKKLVLLVVTIIVGGLVAAALLVVFSSRPLGTDNMMPAATGLSIGIMLGVMGFYTSLPRFYIPAVFGLLCGTGLTMSGIGNNLGTAFLYLAMAFILSITGAITFSRYLKANPAPVDGQQ